MKKSPFPSVASPLIYHPFDIIDPHPWCFLQLPCVHFSSKSIKGWTFTPGPSKRLGLTSRCMLKWRKKKLVLHPPCQGVHLLIFLGCMYACVLKKMFSRAQNCFQSHIPILHRGKKHSTHGCAPKLVRWPHPAKQKVSEKQRTLGWKDVKIKRWKRTIFCPGEDHFPLT